ncbi:ankyrin repeat domain-containing protein [Wolbachia endosymbiont of Armadillidium arcangelii]|uniref:Ankyrin repeat domain-containing protein n=1 Tax=Wolbachia endosymbiont of Armadillidium arcangelii TaxID=3158571 RepID=A0AAU7Q4K0_9RICK
MASIKVANKAALDEITLERAAASLLRGGIMNRDQQKKAIALGMRFYWKTIFTYIKQGDKESAKRLAERCIKENKWESKEVYGYLLALAAEQGEVDIAEFFKDQGANLDCEVCHGRTPLWLAMQYRHNQMVKALKEWGARKDTHDIFGSPSRSHYTPPPFSAGAKSTDQKGEIRDKMELYWPDIFSYIKQGDRESAERMIENLINRSKWESKKEEIYGCLLVIAATQGEIQVAEFCKNHGADLDYVSYGGRTSLWLARVNGKNQMVEALEKWGARGDTDEYCGKSSSDLTKPDYRKIEGFCHNILSECFKTGLSKENLARTVEDFVRNKGYRIKETYGELLLCSIVGRDIKIAEFCKDNGTDLNYKGHSGKTPLEVAEKLKYCEMVEILREWGARKDNKFWSKLPSSSLKDPSCSKQEKQRGCTKKTSCNLM